MITIQQLKERGDKEMVKVREVDQIQTVRREKDNLRGREGDVEGDRWIEGR
jgi:hypothetical protein